MLVTCLQLQRANHRCVSRCSLQSTHHVWSEPEHQRQGAAQGVESADDGRAPGLLHLTAAWDPPDGELRNKHVTFVLHQMFEWIH